MLGVLQFCQQIAQTTSYSYDVREQLSGVSYSPTSAVNFARAYGYDPAGNLLSVTEAALPAANVAYSYDALNRVIGLTENSRVTSSRADKSRASILKIGCVTN